MTALRVCTVVGARPQFVKAAVVSRALRAREGRCTEWIIHTGQHFDPAMSKVFFDEMEIPAPDDSLGIGGGTHGQNTGRMLERIEAVLIDQRPDVVLVYGDTDSTLAGALAAAKLHIPVAHVEAGLRSFNRAMPEELNRVLTDHISSILFTPTAAAVANLHNEGIPSDRVAEVGDVMLDAVRYYAGLAGTRSQILSHLGLETGQYLLATVHRAENVDDAASIARILSGLAASTMPVILPLHPRTRKRISEFGLTVPNAVRVIEPVGYLDMVALERHAQAIVTDSGGVQKEAYFHGVPCITLRDETEWVELVAAGANVLVGTDPDLIGNAIETFRPEITDGGLYGDGRASDRIVDRLLEMCRD